MPDQNELIQVLNNELAIELPEQISFEEIRKKLSRHINFLIQTNFQKLVALLYRIDVSEPKLKILLRESVDIDAGIIIADLIIERQLQKIKYRQQSSQDNNEINENEKW